MSGKVSTLETMLCAYARRFPVAKGKLRVIDALWRLGAGASTRRVATLMHGGWQVPCDIAQMIQRQLYFFGTYLTELPTLRLWEEQARKAGVVLDVGANSGIYSLAALAANPHATVHAFEPTPEIAAGLVHTARLNVLQSLNVHQVAVAARTGRARLNRFRGESGQNEGMNYTTSDVEKGGELVVTVALDDFCADHRIDRIDLLKIDIQGNEPRALQGAQRMLQSSRIGILFMELNWGQDGRSGPASECMQILDAAGYVAARPNDVSHWGRPGEWLYPSEELLARPGAAAR